MLNLRMKRPELAVETILVLGAAYLASAANWTFWRAAFAGRELLEGTSLRFAAATFVLLAALHYTALGLVATRRTVRPLLSLLVFTSALATHFMQQYGIVLDPAMLRNALHTDAREAGELLNAGLAGAILLALALSALPWAVTPGPRPQLARALLIRTGSLAGAVLIAVAALLSGFQDLASQMRNQRSLRYTIAPANVLWSLARALAGDVRAATAARAPLEPVAHAAPAGRKPQLLVMVVGETARAANFSLHGYARPTNPELARLDLINFPRTAACGTSTEVSLPCMFSPFGRAEYDEARIRRHESLPQLLSRAGLRVLWLDNQSGCKGICEGIEFRDMSRARDPDLCAGDRCYDGILLRGLERAVAESAASPGDTMVVLHQLGNHGPAYFRRYPPAMKRFKPACESNELRDCTTAEIVNAYDNAILYTDRVLADTIAFLERQQDRYEVALVYASDHGESLGEHGLYLHGLPYAIAPREQLEVPMFWWLPPQAARGLGVDIACLRRNAVAHASHDSLYHSILGLFEVSTPGYRAARDLFQGCRASQLARAN
jgi:lipid A ethanolaminephosphotransferase